MKPKPVFDLAKIHINLNSSLKKFSAKYTYSVLVLKFVIIFAIFWVAAWVKPYDPDFGWHLQAGDYIWNHGIPNLDIYSYTASTFHWINHEWLSDVILARLFRVLGYNGLTFFYAGMWSAAFFIIKGYKKFLFLILAAMAALPYAGVRATTWTVLLLAVLIRILTLRPKLAKLLIPSLFLVWANLHGGFFIGLVVLGFYAVIKRQTYLWTALIISTLLTFVNPYGVSLYVEIFRTLFDSSLRWQIAEWFPAAFMINSVCFVYSVIWFYGFVERHAKKPKTAFTHLSLWFFLASLSSTRHFPLFVLVSLPEIEANYEVVKQKIPKNLDLPKRLLVSLPLIFITLFTAWSLYGIAAKFHIHMERDAIYPVRAADYFVGHPCDGNTFASYSYGGFLIWKAPGQKTFIDGRMPSWRDENGKKYFDRYDAIDKDKDAVNSPEFKKYNIRCVVWPADPHDTERDDAAIIYSIKKSNWLKINEASADNYQTWLAPD